MAIKKKEEHILKLNIFFLYFKFLSETRIENTEYFPGANQMRPPELSTLPTLLSSTEFSDALRNGDNAQHGRTTHPPDSFLLFISLQNTMEKPKFLVTIMGFFFF